jgi:hypothetical protein
MCSCAASGCSSADVVDSISVGVNVLPFRVRVCLGRCADAIGEKKRRAYIDHTYWARPVPASATPRPASSSSASPPAPTEPTAPAAPSPATAPATSCTPSSTSWAWPANPAPSHRDDGLKLRHAWIASVVRCAPPGDKPTPQEIRNCATHLTAEFRLSPRPRRRLPRQDRLGRLPRHLLQTGVIIARRLHRFAAEYTLPNDGLHLLGSYHPSLRNTNTGRLNRTMFARVFQSA